MKKIIIDGRAGCGKTTYIVRSMLEGVRDYNLNNSQVLVFTNASKTAFRTRLNSFKTVYNLGKIKRFPISTIHKFGTKYVDTSKIFSEYNKECIADLYKVFIKYGVISPNVSERWLSQQLKQGGSTPRLVLDELSWLANTSKSKEEFEKRIYDVPKLAYIYSDLKELGYIYFWDLLFAIIEHIDEIEINKDWLIIDEAQDLTVLQWKVIESIAEKNNCGLVLAMDIYQQLYGGLGANDERSLYHLNTADEVITLTKTWRFPKNYIEFVNEIIQRFKRFNYPYHPYTEGVDGKFDLHFGETVEVLYNSIRNNPEDSIVFLSEREKGLEMLSEVLKTLYPIVSKKYYYLYNLLEYVYKRLIKGKNYTSFSIPVEKGINIEWVVKTFNKVSDMCYVSAVKGKNKNIIINPNEKAILFVGNHYFDTLLKMFPLINLDKELNTIYYLKKQNTVVLSKDNVVFSTVHSYKGKESDTVYYLPNPVTFELLHNFKKRLETIDTYVPGFIGNPCEVEKTNLFIYYVAITRAKKRLYIFAKKG